MRKQELHPRTAALNKKQKIEAKKERNEALCWLSIRFPKVFDTSMRIQPLKLGILSDLLVYADEASSAGVSKSKLREALVIFTRRIDYLTCLKAREMRVDLDGNPTTLVTEEEANCAAEKIKRRVEKSAKNARKNAGCKSVGVNGQRSTNPQLKTTDQESISYSSVHPPAFAAEYAPITARAPAVVVKHKSSRTYDPDAVARLREKLGLSRKKDLQDV